MKVLIVYAPEEPQSFNAALKDHAVRVLTNDGHSVEVSDLYAMNFDPVGGKLGPGSGVLSSVLRASDVATIITTVLATLAVPQNLD